MGEFSLLNWKLHWWVSSMVSSCLHYQVDSIDFFSLQFLHFILPCVKVLFWKIIHLAAFSFNILWQPNINRDLSSNWLNIIFPVFVSVMLRNFPSIVKNLWGPIIWPALTYDFIIVSSLNSTVTSPYSRKKIIHP